MSSDEELLALGRLVKEHKAIRGKVALLSSEVLAIGKLLIEIGQKLTVGGGHIIHAPKLTDEQIAGFAGAAARLPALLTELEGAVAMEKVLRAKRDEVE